MLTACQDRYPQEFAKLVHAVGVEAQPPFGGSALFRTKFRDWFDEDGQPTTLIRAVLTSALRDTPEGTVLINPFHLESEADRQLFASVEQDYDRVLRGLFRRPGDLPPGRSIS
jgi:hypothetical protein